MLVTKLPLLNDTECKSLAIKVIGLQEKYQIEVQDRLYTLGIALYQKKADTKKYFDLSKVYNELLWENFSLFYVRVLRALQSYFGEAAFKFGWSIPGFHIFDFKSLNYYSGGDPHFDLSFFELNKTISYDNLPPHFSFTLPICIPKYGTGLDIWDLNFAEIVKSKFTLQAETECSKRTRHFVNYNLGEMVIFDAYQYHQIAAIPKIVKDDQRISLQGHCYYQDGKYQIYW